MINQSRWLYDAPQIGCCTNQLMHCRRRDNQLTERTSNTAFCLILNGNIRWNSLRLDEAFADHPTGSHHDLSLPCGFKSNYIYLSLWEVARQINQEEWDRRERDRPLTDTSTHHHSSINCTSQIHIRLTGEPIEGKAATTSASLIQQNLNVPAITNLHSHVRVIYHSIKLYSRP